MPWPDTSEYMNSKRVEIIISIVTKSFNDNGRCYNQCTILYWTMPTVHKRKVPQHL